MSKAKEQNNKLPKDKRTVLIQSFDGSTLNQDSQVGSFSIEQELGRGGAGVVYLAHDTKLDRKVAIKSMPPELANNPVAKSRFQREARLLASMNHPNIAVIYDIVENQEGAGYLVLEYVSGQTLAERIMCGRIELEEVLSISEQIARAIASAHEHGVIHRDLKPGNIKITPEGTVKVLDFGLAKAVSGTALDRQITLTQQDRMIGTPAYMSPEQARGEPVDYRTDIWSLGIVIYEMLTGELPFKGNTMQTITHSILYEKPEYLRNLRKGLPVILEQSVLKMLQKEPLDRYQNIGSIINVLKSLKRDSAKHSNSYQKSPSIAVLPFVNMSADKEQEYFCDGMAEELINALTQIRDLHVIARTSAFSYKGKDVKVRDIGRELNVETVLEGSVRRAADKLRITAQLIDTANGHHLWSERYDREIGDVFAIQDEITLAIVDKLEPKLLGKEKARLVKGKDVDVEAYQLYLRGRFFWNKRGVANIKKSIRCLELALEMYPDYALAYAGLAVSYATLPIYSLLPPKQGFSKAREMASRALEIDETVPEAHASLGFIKTWYDWDWTGAESQFERAIELNPGCAMAHHWYGFTFLFSGRFEEAIKKIEQALRLDPISVAINRDLGLFCYHAGWYDLALEASKKCIEMDPHMIYAHTFLGEAYLGKEMYEEALGEFLTESEVTGSLHGWIDPLICFTYQKLGKVPKAQEVLDSSLEHSKQKYFSPFFLACMYITLGRNDEGFEFLEKAFEEHDHVLCWLKIHPLLESVHSDPRYTALLKKMNFDE